MHIRKLLDNGRKRVNQLHKVTRYTHQRRCLAQIATKGSCMPNLRGIPGKPWRPIASTSNNYYYLAHAQKRDRHINIYIYIYIYHRVDRLYK